MLFGPRSYIHQINDLVPELHFSQFSTYNQGFFHCVNYEKEIMGFHKKYCLTKNYINFLICSAIASILMSIFFLIIENAAVFLLARYK